MKSDTPTKLKPFAFHGVDISWNKSSNEATGECPFCMSGNFYVNKSTGQFHCKSCDERGNGLTFLKLLHDYAVKGTKREDLVELSEQRNVPVEGLQHFGLARSPIDGCWLVPQYNAKKKLANLCRAFKDVEGKWKVFSTPGCKLHPFGINHLTDKQTRRHVVEGVWDLAALWSVMSTIRKRGTRYVKTTDPKQSLAATEAVIGVPGAGNFNEDWLAYLDGEECRLYFDNDHPRKHPTSGKTTKPGWDGMNRIAKIAGESGNTPSALYRIKWGRGGYDKALADGYDVRDLIQDNGGVKALGMLGKLSERIKIDHRSVEDEESGDQVEVVEALPRNAFKKLVEDFKVHLHWTEMLEDTLAAMLATIVSTDLKGEQLWLRVIGPPGSGKTTLVECFSVCREYVFSQSIFTGFHSGFTGGSKKDKKKGKDASLLPQMDGKTFCIKDGDTLLTAPNRDRILAELRDIYDGTSRASYRNRKAANYEGLRISMIVCGTDTLRQLNRSSLGERFLDIEILGGESTQPYLDQAMDNAYSKVIGSLMAEKDDAEDNEVKGDDAATYLKRCCLGYVQYLKDNLTELPVPKMSKAIGERLKALGQTLALMRAKVNRDREGMISRPRPELATRLVGQLTKMAICIALATNKKSIDDGVFRVCRKIGFTSADGFQLEISALLVKYPNGLSSKQIALELNLPETSVKRYLNDMMELDIVNKRERPNRSGVRGRNLHVWKMDKEVRTVWLKAIGGKA